VSPRFLNGRWSPLLFYSVSTKVTNYQTARTMVLVSIRVFCGAV